jgi:hypothetical protein
MNKCAQTFIRRRDYLATLAELVNTIGREGYAYTQQGVGDLFVEKPMFTRKFQSKSQNTPPPPCVCDRNALSDTHIPVE